MPMTVDDITEDAVHFLPSMYEKIMKSDKPGDGAYLHRLLMIYEHGETTTADGKIINPKRKIAETVARKYIEIINALSMDLIRRNLGKGSDNIPIEDRELLSYLGPRSVIPFETYVGAVELARPKVVAMMGEIRETAYRSRGLEVTVK